MLRRRGVSVVGQSLMTKRRIGIAGAAAITLAMAALSLSNAVLSKPILAAFDHTSVPPPALATAKIVDAGCITQQAGWRLTAAALETTEDAGVTWSSVTPPGVQPAEIGAVFFADPIHGWLVTSPRTGAAGLEILVYRTTDGGKSWVSSQVAPPSAQFGGPIWMYFVDPQHGWIETSLTSSAAFSFSALFRTDDGGATWTQLKSPAAGEIAFATPMDGWLAGGVANTNLYSTHDGGQTWSDMTPPLPSGTAAHDVAYSLGGRSGTVGLRADIGGNPGTAVLFDLTPQGAGRPVQTLRDASVQESDPAAVPVAVAGPGTLVTVLDRGQEDVAAAVATATATTVKTNLPITANAFVKTLSFATPLDGWAIISGGACAQFKTGCISYSALYATSDGGVSWTQLGGN